MIQSLEVSNFSVILKVPVTYKVFSVVQSIIILSLSRNTNTFLENCLESPLPESTMRRVTKTEPLKYPLSISDQHGSIAEFEIERNDSQWFLGFFHNILTVGVPVIKKQPIRCSNATTSPCNSQRRWGQWLQIS